ncbi:MAG: hypothetical protein ARM1_0485 [Candidatus Micrarchaeota archaeon]|nr:MAG: hypothetical protein ARM1_0485 [Candidatus Micrarchaeota archaeon]
MGLIELELNRELQRRIDENLSKNLLYMSFRELTSGFNDRLHISKSILDEFEQTYYLGYNDKKEIINFKKGVSDKRYIAALDLSYDIFLTLYEINSRSLFGIRALPENLINFYTELNRFVRSLKLKKKRFEIRIFGLQNNYGADYIRELYNILDNKLKLPIVEIDLFGNELREIAVDAYTGLSYKILKFNRLYKPNELLNTISLEQFKASIK